MKVQLIVVQGKPEGKTIPLLVPRFKIGRGETCHLRPNSEQVSREHAEFAVGPDAVTVTDLGSRNGTLVNGRAITGAQSLKNGDLVQVGPLTFAVSIEGAPQAQAAKPAAPASASTAAAAKAGSIDDVSNDEIDSWLIADKEKPAPESPSGVYAGDTITISAFKDASNPQPTPPQADDNDEEYERLEGEGEGEGEDQDDDEESDASDEMPEDFIDESNPFYVKKKKGEAAAGPAKPAFENTSDAASEILRKMMERKKQQRS